MAIEKCPKCGTEKHKLNACSSCGFRRNISLNKKEKTLTNTSKKIQRNQASDILQAFKDQKESSDSKIRNYIQLNPVKDSIGPLGKPQDKYRWGFYGSKSMDYDNWGKSE